MARLWLTLAVLALAGCGQVVTTDSRVTTDAGIYHVCPAPDANWVSDGGFTHMNAWCDAGAGG